MTVADFEAGKGDEALERATGRVWAAWFGLLDAAGAEAWKHKDIAAWLVAEHGVDGWWAQAITIGFEQARGIRRPGQRQDGTFEVSASTSTEAGQAAALAALIAVVRAALDAEPAAINTGARYHTARWKLESGETVQASADPPKDGKTRIGLSWSRMPDESRLAETKARLRDWLRAAK